MGEFHQLEFYTCVVFGILMYCMYIQVGEEFHVTDGRILKKERPGYTSP